MIVCCDRTYISTGCVVAAISIFTGAANPAFGRNRRGALLAERLYDLATPFMNSPGKT